MFRLKPADPLFASCYNRMLVPGKMQHVICTGNLNAEQYEELRELAPNLHVVQGDMDNFTDNPHFPETRVVQVGMFRIGVVHGHQVIPWKSQSALARWRRKLNCDVLISGHTHQNEVSEVDGHYHINPGSITGAYSPLTKDVKPSFVLLAIRDDKVVCYVYELVNGEVEVSKTEFSKKSS
jgi:vacuolar protein sorting-associated protein 29